MADGNDGPTKVLEEVFQNRQRGNVQIISRFIEKQHIGFFNQEFQEKETFFLPTGEFFNQGSVHGTRKEELLQEIRDRGGSDSRLHFFSHFLQEIDHALALI